MVSRERRSTSVESLWAREEKLVLKYRDVLIQVFAGFGENVPPGLAIPRDSNAERMLQQRGFKDTFLSDLRLGVPRYEAEEMQTEQSTGVPSSDAVDRGLQGLSMEDSTTGRTLSAIFESTVLDFDMYLDQDLEWSWSFDKVQDYQESITCSGAFSGMCESEDKATKEELRAKDNQDMARSKREAELALEVAKFNRTRFSKGAIIPLAHNLAHVEVSRSLLSEAAQMQHAVKLIYDIVDKIVCRSWSLARQDGSADVRAGRCVLPGGEESFRPEGYFGLRTKVELQDGLCNSFYQIEEIKQAELLQGSLRFLEESYWQWLRDEVLPSVQSQDPSLSTGARKGMSVAVGIVRAWVRWFLGDAQEQAGWEMAVFDKNDQVPLWPQVFFLIRTGHYMDALSMVDR
ncbi:hypothetical protein GUITHDRAFT_144807 [Guillardia theta CCMP2712]|uniref:Nuclear pore protein n=1 Tax=Guillardia theta (strain CCMP2712) TaxID=905079 RepID=L1IN19_GUITC|nr:hypothetical protein GUITHDRAFT_144807 [Guillardia theta CCMP2712]EKX37681.1 hypothetical protein GUITHDRAFT_144807 [Guillardia theta CCMP2712]|eukprot:XP_005824661.1 hypothetical protein GUITHDRAFT_144807 [Guillardia theta CCMP2712]